MIIPKAVDCHVHLRRDDELTILLMKGLSLWKTRGPRLWWR